MNNRTVAITRINTHHFDVVNHGKRAFSIRGVPGGIFIRDEREQHSRLENTPCFSTASAAILWCVEELLMT